MSDNSGANEASKTNAVAANANAVAAMVFGAGMSDEEGEALRTLLNMDPEQRTKGAILNKPDADEATDKTNEASKTKATAFDGHIKKAEAGSAEAMNVVGLCYDSGRGVPKDMAKAIEWYTKAAEKGDSNAMINLGGIHDDEAKKWEAKAAQTDKASEAAMNYLAGYHKQKAKQWYNKKATDRAKATNTEADEASKAGGKRNATEAGIEEPSDAPVTPKKQRIPPWDERPCPGAPTTTLARAH